MRKILITGGTGLIGTVLVKEMIADGHSVLFTCRNKQRGEELIKTNNLPSDHCQVVEVDFNKIEELDEWAKSLPLIVDTVIHNARSLDYIKPDLRGRLGADQIQQEYFMAVTFPYLLTYSLIDAKHELKDIIFISSMYGVVAPNPTLYDDFQKQSPLNYGVSKAAQIHLVKELAVRLAPEQIRVNAISYGGVEGRVGDAFKTRYRRMTPSGRMLDHTDLYPPVQYFINNQGLNVTGENLKVDGGWTIW